MKSDDISRRSFIRGLGMASLAALAPSCVGKSETGGKTPTVKGEMTRRVNPNTGDSVSLLGYGCMRLPVIEKNEADGQDEIDQEMVNRLTDHAIANGVNYFDTSPVYCKGRSEHAMGLALSRHPRESYYIATKLSNFDPSTWPRERSIEMFENSLRELRTDYVDYMLLHSIGGGGMETFDKRYTDNGILQYLIEQKAAGRIRNLGFSYHGDIEVFDNMLARMDRGEVHWDFVQIQLNYIDWLHAKEVNTVNTNAEYLYGELHRRGIPVVIMEPLLGGRLASVTAPVAAKLKARRPDDSVASWAFRFAGTPEGVLTVLSGMTYMEHLEDNLATYSPLRPVDDSEREFLEIIAEEILANNEIPCTDCRNCLPCPYGINIPAIFAHYNKCLKDDNVSRDTRDPHYQSARRAFLVGYDRKVPKLRQADRCVACGNCISECPQSIAIPARLREISEYVNRLKAGKA